jgi:murein DD-endopeptidase MepM/ murein hydrolase activator NlpD
MWEEAFAMISPLSNYNSQYEEDFKETRPSFFHFLLDSKSDSSTPRSIPFFLKAFVLLALMAGGLFLLPWFTRSSGVIAPQFDVGSVSIEPAPLEEISDPIFTISKKTRASVTTFLKPFAAESNWLSDVSDESIRNADKMALEFTNRENELSQTELQLTFQDGSQQIWAWDGANLKNYTIEKPEEEITKVLFGIVQGSFSNAAKQAGASQGLVDDLVDIFSERVQFGRDLKLGDRFTVIYRAPMSMKTENKKKKSLKPNAQKNSEASEPVVLAAAFNIGKKEFVAIRYVGSDGKARYFDDQARPLGQNFLRYPLKFTKISAAFSGARFHPILHRTRPHNGVDFAAPIGTAVRSISDGRVILAGYRGTSGNMVRIRHNDRFTTEYLHLNSIDPKLKRGTAVEKGQVIGTVGTTGLSTGPHLHFGLFDRGKYVNPMTVQLPDFGTLKKGLRISQTYLERVLFTLTHYQRVQVSPYTS